MSKPSIEVIIPSWNGKDLLQKNIPGVLKAIQELSASHKKLTVVDDGSDDGSAGFLSENFPEVHLLINEKNRGFHYSVNRAVLASSADLILLLNSDMEPEALAFQALYERFLIQPKLFAVSGRIYSDDKKEFLYGNRGGRFEQGHFFLEEKDEFSESQTLFACGGAGLFHREKFIELGMFDTLFSPFYYEEQDICYRALKRNLSIAYEPKSVMYHAVSATIQKKVSNQAKRLISARNNYLFVFKNITDTKYAFEALLFTPLYILGALLKANPRFFLAFLMALPRLPRAFFHRFKEQRFYERTDREIFEIVKG